MQKTKRIRLTGKQLEKLNNDIHYRDGHTCIGCGRYVLPGVKFHHEKIDGIKEDKIECGVTLCMDCHYERHHGRDNSQDIKQQCIDYLRGLYPEHWGSEIC